MAPTTDVTGLPVYNKSVIAFGDFNMATYTWQNGSFVLSGTGDTTLTTTVDSRTDLSQVPLSGETVRDAYNNQVFTPHAKYASVDAAYRAVAALLEPSDTALPAAQKAAISLTDVKHAVAGDEGSPVVAYTVALKGDYPAQGFPLRLGDLQRSAIRVLTTALQSSAFEELAGLNGVKGVKVGPYTSQFENVEPAVTATLTRVSKDSGHPHGSGPGSGTKGHSRS
ncbi:hypothetical protein ACIBO4_03965 [Streptomyces sp. NPDC050149]|uniref:hypothetical protein n=1 Tax=Streptomyces sp. NPDC050149 TaxID=3365603 RepID=UPI003794708E